MTDDRISSLREAMELLLKAADIMDSALRMSGFESRSGDDADMIRRIASSDSYGGSLSNIIRDMEYGSQEQPCWTQALTSPKNQFPSDDDGLGDL
ncbi:MAG: hypothetical protein ACI38Y_01865 [Candidatus Methanomethylophilaceae archaeon]